MSKVSEQIDHDKAVRAKSTDRIKNAAIEAYIGWHAPGIFNLRCGVRRYSFL